MNIDDILDHYINNLNKTVNKFKIFFNNNNNQKTEHLNNFIKHINDLNDNIENLILNNNDNNTLNNIQKYYFDKEILPKLTYMYIMLDNKILNAPRTSGTSGTSGPPFIS